MFDLELQNYIDWDVQSVFKRSDRNRFAYRVVLQFMDGTKHTRMYSGFSTKKEAEDARKMTMRESGIKAVGVLFFRMRDIFAVPATVGNRDQKISTGDIIRSF